MLNMTCDTLHMACDTWWMVAEEHYLKFQLSSSYGLGVMMF